MSHIHIYIHIELNIYIYIHTLSLYKYIINYLAIKKHKYMKPLIPYFSITYYRDQAGIYMYIAFTIRYVYTVRLRCVPTPSCISLTSHYRLYSCPEPAAEARIISKSAAIATWSDGYSADGNNVLPKYARGKKSNILTARIP